LLPQRRRKAGGSLTELVTIQAVGRLSFLSGKEIGRDNRQGKYGRNNTRD